MIISTETSPSREEEQFLRRSFDDDSNHVVYFQNIIFKELCRVPAESVSFCAFSKFFKLFFKGPKDTVSTVVPALTAYKNHKTN